VSAISTESEIFRLDAMLMPSFTETGDVSKFHMCMIYVRT